jgi:hypothetical protein
MALTTSPAAMSREASLSGVEPEAHRVIARAEEEDVADAGQAGDLVTELEGA